MRVIKKLIEKSGRYKLDAVWFHVRSWNRCTGNIAKKKDLYFKYADLKDLYFACADLEIAFKSSLGCCLMARKLGVKGLLVGFFSARVKECLKLISSK